MDFLWSPWRYAYVSTAAEPRSCVFCIPPAAEASTGEDRDRLILHRASRNFVILNLYPYTSGHLMVAPYDHVGALGEVDSGTLVEMTDLVQRSVGVLEQAYRPEGFNVGLNLGLCAGAGVRDHIHMHVVPRWCGDVNFMTATSETRVLPEGLGDSYRRLKPLFDALGA